MACCVKCLRYKQLNEVLTIEKSTKRGLFEALFKNAYATELTICKKCFGELAEFLNEEDFVDEIPVSWMQDEDIKEEDCDFEQEIPRYDIVAANIEEQISNKNARHASSKHVNNIPAKKRQKTNVSTTTIAKNKKQTKVVNKQTQAKDQKFDIPTFVLSDDSLPSAEHGVQADNENLNDYIAQNAVPSADAFCFESLCDDNAFTNFDADSHMVYYEILTEGDALGFDNNLLENNFINEREIQNDHTDGNNSAAETVTSSLIAENFSHNHDSLANENTLQSTKISNGNVEIPTYEIDDDSDGNNSVHFVDELRFKPPENIAEESLGSIDLKEDVETHELQSVDSASVIDDATKMSLVENDSESCSIAEQMRILEEFEKQCEVIEQRSAGNRQKKKKRKKKKRKGAENGVVEDTILITSDTEESSECHTFSFSTGTGSSFDQEAFICSVCGQISDKSWKIQEHITFADLKSTCKDACITEQKLQHAVCCEHCGLAFRSASDLKAHRATGIHSDSLFHCSECTACFKDFRSLNKHNKSHADIPKSKFNTVFMCNVGNCDQTFFSWPQLGEHKDKSHVAQICPLCRINFHDARFFAKHVKICKSDALKCDHCVKKFYKSGSETLTIHKKNCPQRNLEKDFQCDYCAARFKTTVELCAHNASKHFAITCELCFKAFANKISKRNHLNTCKVRKK